MANLFAVLGLAESLTLEPEEVDRAWQALTRESPPQSDDGTEDSSEIHHARRILSDPVSRLEHWLERHGIALERGSSMAPDFMDLFSQIHEALAKADSVYGRHEKATTALTKALLSREAIEAQLAVQDCLSLLHQKKSRRIGQFAAFEEASQRSEYHDAATTLGQLKFLKKWEQQCRERLLKLIEC
ncbi:MAG: hypothetical protein P1U81_19785 [Verrucomicrobiales bacterium]|jgi:hypothetical protein|nr:hypothetical protein [Verrucomicrobiales bacterium]